MTQEQMVELVKQHHPKKSEKQIRIWPNQALEEFGRRTALVRDTKTFNTVSEQRYYSFSDIDSLLFEIDEVWFDDWSIARLQGLPSKRDSS